jgi:hypothetical protein
VATSTGPSEINAMSVKLRSLGVQKKAEKDVEEVSTSETTCPIRNVLMTMGRCTMIWVASKSNIDLKIDWEMLS